MSSREKITTHIRKMFKRIKRLENIVNELKAIQQNNIGGNRLRDERITEIDNNLYSLRSFIREKLSNHPDDYLNYVRHTSDQLLGSNLDTTSVPSNDSLSGGRRKKKNKRKKKKKTRKKKGGKIPLKKVEEIKKKEHNPATHRRLVDEVGEVEPEVIIDILRVIDESDLELGSDSDDEGISGGGRRKKKTRKKRHRSKKKTKKKY